MNIKARGRTSPENFAGQHYRREGKRTKHRNLGRDIANRGMVNNLVSALHTNLALALSIAT
jgi:hypothetical protein